MFRFITDPIPKWMKDYRVLQSETLMEYIIERKKTSFHYDGTLYKEWSQVKRLYSLQEVFDFFRDLALQQKEEVKVTWKKVSMREIYDAIRD